MTTAAILFTLALCLALPVLLLLVWNRRTGAGLRGAGIGAAVFVGAVLLLERLLHLLVLTADTPVRAFVTGNAWVYALYAGLAAGVFEECGRYAAFRLFLLKRRAGRAQAVMYGIGHGGAEMLLVGAQTMANNLILLLVLRLVGAQALEAAFPAGQADALLRAGEALRALAPGDVLLGALERVSALLLQLSLSVFVFAAARDRRRVLLPAAIALHAAADIPAALYQAGRLANLPALEAGLFLLSLAAGVCAALLYRRLPAQGQDGGAAAEKGRRAGPPR